MPIQELALLATWKSSVVLTYAEDALQTEPANLGMSENPKNFLAKNGNTGMSRTMRK